MKKIERILSIVVLLLEKELISSTELAERFGVSKRTILRDITTIEQAGFPIVAVQGRKGGFSLMPTFKLRTFTYSNNEKQEILNAIQIKESLLGRMDPTYTIKEKIRLLKNEETAEELKLALSSPTIHRPEIEADSLEKIETIQFSLDKKWKLKLYYVDGLGRLTERLVHPYELALLNGSWYLFAYCEERQSFRYFKVTRIRKVEMETTKFEKVSVENKKWLQTEKLTVQLKFKRTMLGMLYDYYLEEEMEISEDCVLVSFQTVQVDTLLVQLLIFGPNVQVISPEKLRQQHKTAIDNLQRTYE